MSHFTVLVIGDNAEEQLAPFDENDREQFTDEEAEYKEEYKTKTIDAVVFSDGRMFTKYDEAMKPHWKRAGIGISSKDEFITPHGATIEVVPMKKIYKTFDKFMKEWHGMTKDKEFGKYGSRSNPKAKWDWYQLGGRWTGFFKLKSKKARGGFLRKSDVAALAETYGVTQKYIETYAALAQHSDSEAFDWSMKNPVRGGYELQKKIKALLTPVYDDAEIGEPGLGADIAKPGYADSALVKDIDFEGMVAEAGLEAKERYEKVERLLGGAIPKLTYLWSDMIDKDNEQYSKMSIEEKRTMYHGQLAKKIVQKASEEVLSKDDRSLLIWLDLEDYQVSKEEYVRRAENRALSTFAVLKDGEWYEKGEMGWFGMAHNEKDQDKWNEEFMKLIRDLPGDTVISVYDCHI